MISVNRSIHSNNSIMKEAILFRSRGFKEILFGLFPSIFMPYLDVDTFLSLLKTDLWNWHHLLSDRIVFDYCNFISIRHKEQIQQFCTECDSLSYDSSDTVYYDTDNYNEMDIDNYNQDQMKYIPISDVEQNFAILRILCKETVEINEIFIFNVFYDVDIIHDRMSLEPAKDLGITTNLCKQLAVRKKNIRIAKKSNDFIKNTNKMHTIFEYDTFEELQNNLESKQYYTDADLMHIKTILITDILDICVDRWYFVEWHQINAEHVEILETKQMIIGHFNYTKYNFKQNRNINHDGNITSNCKRMKQELFVVWSIEWQQYKQK